MKVKVVKNKVVPPFCTAELDVLFGSGVDTTGCLLDAAEMLGVIERKGEWRVRAGCDDDCVSAVKCNM